MQNYRIILARHGENEDNANEIMTGIRDLPLTEKGLRQAHDLTESLRLGEIRVTVIFSGPLCRACQTASVCAESFQIPHTIIPSLMERDHGILEGRPYSDIPLLAKSYREVDGYFYINEVEGAEDYPTLCLRAQNVLADIHTKARELAIQGDILVIGHGALNKALFVAHRQLPWESILDLKPFGNCEFRILE